MGRNNLNKTSGRFDRTAEYRQEYADSLKDPDKYWGNRAEQLVSWFRKWDTVVSGDFSSDSVGWFSGALVNASYNCLDRHLERGDGEKDAFIWQGEKGEIPRFLPTDNCTVKSVDLPTFLKKGSR